VGEKVVRQYNLDADRNAGLSEMHRETVFTRLTTTDAAASQTGDDDSARRVSGLVLRLMTE
jgi:hypothetical protein